MTVRTLFGQPTSGVPSAVTNDNSSYTMGNQFKVTSAATLTGVWFFSAPGAISLPSVIGLYAVTGPVQVHTETPVWSGGAGTGWVRSDFATPQTLTVDAFYKIVVNDTAGSNFYSGTAHYWDSGPGSAGITNGPLTAPNNAGSDGGQSTFHSGSIAYPDTSFNATNYWIDPEITDNTLAITTVSLPAATNGVPYSTFLAAAGGTSPYTWAISSGSLPAWASLNTSTGEIHGTPNAVATTSFTVQVTDNVSATDTKALSLEVDPAGSPGTTGALLAGFI